MVLFVGLLLSHLLALFCFVFVSILCTDDGHLARSAGSSEVGLRKEWFARIRFRWQSSRETLQSAYRNVFNEHLIFTSRSDFLSKFSFKGPPCVLSATAGDIILLPATLAEWIVSQPDEVLRVKVAHIDHIQADNSFSHTAVVRQPHH